VYVGDVGLEGLGLHPEMQRRQVAELSHLAARADAGNFQVDLLVAAVKELDFNGLAGLSGEAFGNGAVQKQIEEGGLARKRIADFGDGGGDSLPRMRRISQPGLTPAAAAGESGVMEVTRTWLSITRVSRPGPASPGPESSPSEDEFISL